MRKAAQIGFSVLGGGLALGAVLGAYADPEMKRAPDPAWQSTGRPAIEPGPVQHFVSLPQDLGPPSGYRPDLDYAAEIIDWAPRYPSWTYGDVEPPDLERPGEQLAYADETPPPEREATGAVPAMAERAEAGFEASPEGHRIAQVQADGLW